MNTYKPKVSVLMPVYNGEKYLGEAIESIINQTFDDFEFLIFDGGSSDSSVEIIESYDDKRINLIRSEEFLNLTQTLNKGLEIARGQYVARMDCDDISLPERLAQQVAYMDSHPQVGICGAWVETTGEIEGDIWRYPTEPDEIRSHLLFNCVIAHPTVFLRVSKLREHNLKYDEDLTRAEDYDLWQRCSSYFPITNIPKVLLRYRIAATNISRVQAKEHSKALAQINKKFLSDLGLDVDEETLDLHMAIGMRTFYPDQALVSKAESYMETLRMANSTSRIYPEPAFSKMLAEQWFDICNLATGLGLWAWKKFLSSDLYRYYPLKPLKITKFFVKSCLRNRHHKG